MLSGQTTSPCYGSVERTDPEGIESSIHATEGSTERISGRLRIAALVAIGSLCTASGLLAVTIPLLKQRPQAEQQNSNLHSSKGHREEYTEHGVSAAVCIANHCLRDVFWAYLTCPIRASRSMSCADSYPPGAVATMQCLNPLDTLSKIVVGGGGGGGGEGSVMPVTSETAETASSSPPPHAHAPPLPQALLSLMRCARRHGCLPNPIPDPDPSSSPLPSPCDGNDSDSADSGVGGNNGSEGGGGGGPSSSKSAGGGFKSPRGTTKSDRATMMGLASVGGGARGGERGGGEGAGWGIEQSQDFAADEEEGPPEWLPPVKVEGTSMAGQGGKWVGLLECLYPRCLTEVAVLGVTHGASPRVAEVFHCLGSAAAPEQESCFNFEGEEDTSTEIQDLGVCAQCAGCLLNPPPPSPPVVPVTAPVDGNGVTQEEGRPGEGGGEGKRRELKCLEEESPPTFQSVLDAVQLASPPPVKRTPPPQQEYAPIDPTHDGPNPNPNPSPGEGVWGCLKARCASPLAWLVAARPPALEPLLRCLDSPGAGVDNGALAATTTNNNKNNSSSSKYPANGEGYEKGTRLSSMSQSCFPGADGEEPSPANEAIAAVWACGFCNACFSESVGSVAHALEDDTRTGPGGGGEAPGAADATGSYTTDNTSWGTREPLVCVAVARAVGREETGRGRAEAREVGDMIWSSYDSVEQAWGEGGGGGHWPRNPFWPGNPWSPRVVEQFAEGSGGASWFGAGGRGRQGRPGGVAALGGAWSQDWESMEWILWTNGYYASGQGQGHSRGDAREWARQEHGHEEGRGVGGWESWAEAYNTRKQKSSGWGQGQGQGQWHEGGDHRGWISWTDSYYRQGEGRVEPLGKGEEGTPHTSHTDSDNQGEGEEEDRWGRGDEDGEAAVSVVSTHRDMNRGDDGISTGTCDYSWVWDCVGRVCLTQLAELAAQHPVEMCEVLSCLDIAGANVTLGSQCLAPWSSTDLLAEATAQASGQTFQEEDAPAITFTACVISSGCLAS